MIATHPLYHLAIGEGWNTGQSGEKAASNVAYSRHMQRLGRKFKRTHLLAQYGAVRDHGRGFTNVIRFTRIS